jgi:hypothetical protein
MALVLVMAWAFAGPLRAQSEPAERERVVVPEVRVDELERGSPQSAVRGYLAACRAKDYEKAARYLDLRRIEGDPATLARQLRVVLSRTLWIDIEGLSPESEGRSADDLPPDRDRLGTISTSRGDVEILLQCQDSGRSSATEHSSPMCRRSSSNSSCSTWRSGNGLR